VNCSGIELVIFDLYVTRFNLSKARGLLFLDLFIADSYKLHPCDHRVIEFSLHSLQIDW